MQTRKPASLLLVVGLATGMSLSGCSPKENDSGAGASAGALGLMGSSHEETDVIVSLEECPGAVQATIRDHLDGGELIEIERTTDHGEVLFEVDVQGDEGIFEFDVAEDGAFRGYEDDGAEDEDDDDDDGEEDEDEEEIPLSEVPQVVKDAAAAAVPGIVLEEASRETEDERVIYELEGEANGTEYEIEVTEDGEVLEVEEDEEDDDEGDDDDD